jgi:hypothetical protein
VKGNFRSGTGRAAAYPATFSRVCANHEAKLAMTALQEAAPAMGRELRGTDRSCRSAASTRGAREAARVECQCARTVRAIACKRTSCAALFALATLASTKKPSGPTQSPAR